MKLVLIKEGWHVLYESVKDPPIPPEKGENSMPLRSKPKEVAHV